MYDRFYIRKKKNLFFKILFIDRNDLKNDK